MFKDTGLTLTYQQKLEVYEIYEIFNSSFSLSLYTMCWFLGQKHTNFMKYYKKLNHSNVKDLPIKNNLLSQYL